MYMKVNFESKFVLVKKTTTHFKLLVPSMFKSETLEMTFHMSKVYNSVKMSSPIID